MSIADWLSGRVKKASTPSEVFESLKLIPNVRTTGISRTTDINLVSNDLNSVLRTSSRISEKKLKDIINKHSSLLGNYSLLLKRSLKGDIDIDIVKTLSNEILPLMELSGELKEIFSSVSTDYKNDKERFRFYSCFSAVYDVLVLLNVLLGQKLDIKVKLLTKDFLSIAIKLTERLNSWGAIETQLILYSKSATKK